MKEEILEYFKDINFAYNDCTRFDTLKRMLDELEQEPKTGWIPVAERLPEDVNDVLCWYIYSKNDKLYQTYGIGFYWNEIWGGEKWHGERCKVIAWMPLPEPYKAETLGKDGE